MKKVFIFGIIFVLASFMVFAHGNETFDEAKQLIDSKVSCDNLSDAQLESLGDYYMEQIHPGEAHEQMDAMMGGEGSESLKQMHINMGKMFYCSGANVSSIMGSGMMSSGMMSSGMMGSGMMGGNNLNSKNGGINMMGSYGSYGMMGGLGFFGMGLFWLLYIAIGAFVFGLIFWWTKKIVMKDTKHEKKK